MLFPSTHYPGAESETPGVVSFPTPISPIVARGPLSGLVSGLSVEAGLHVGGSFDVTVPSCFLDSSVHIIETKCELSGVLWPSYFSYMITFR